MAGVVGELSGWELLMRDGSEPPMSASRARVWPAVRRVPAVSALFAVLLVSVWTTSTGTVASPVAAAGDDGRRAAGGPRDGGGQIVVVAGDQDGRGAPRIDLGVVDPAAPGAPDARADGAPGRRTGRCRWVPAPEVEAWLRRFPSAAGGPGGRARLLSRLFGQVCDGVTVSYAWAGSGVGAAAGGRVVPVTVGELAREAYTQLRLPVPTPGHSPDLTLADGRSAVLVGEHTWVWTDRSRFRPRSRRLQAGAVWAQVTATPVGLTFDPGDGDPAISCRGPGTEFVPGRSPRHRPSPTCGYRYSRSSAGQPGGLVTAEYGIRWRVRWTGSTGTAAAAGALPELTSRATTRFAVAEAQALGTARGPR
jgi:hypothetical protein